MPVEVRERARDELLILPGADASILEISHRSPAFEAAVSEAEMNLRELLRIGQDHRVLFLQGGNRSLYNTPPVFSIYVLMLVTRWLRDGVGGLDEMRAANLEKASTLSGAIDASDGFY